MVIQFLFTGFFAVFSCSSSWLEHHFSVLPYLYSRTAWFRSIFQCFSFDLSDPHMTYTHTVFQRFSTILISLICTHISCTSVFQLDLHTPAWPTNNHISVPTIPTGKYTYIYWYRSRSSYIQFLVFFLHLFLHIFPFCSFCRCPPPPFFLFSLLADKIIPLHRCSSGCNCYEHCWDKSHYWRHHVRGGPRVREAEGLQLEDRDGLPGRHPYLTGMWPKFLAISCRHWFCLYLPYIIFRSVKFDHLLLWSK